MKSNASARAAASHGQRLNALKHGLRSTALLLPGDDPAELRRLRRELYELLRPRTGNEVCCVEAILSHRWAMERCRRWREQYHANLTALLCGNADGTQAAHAGSDPHQWQHGAMDCALEENRLGRLQDRERKRLDEMQKLRRQNLLRDAQQQADEGPVLWPAEDDAPAHETAEGNGVPSRASAPAPQAPIAAQPTPSTDGAIQNYRKQMVRLPGDFSGGGWPPAESRAWAVDRPGFRSRRRRRAGSRRRHGR